MAKSAFATLLLVVAALGAAISGTFRVMLCMYAFQRLGVACLVEV
jgi:hypothetical protein